MYIHIIMPVFCTYAFNWRRIHFHLFYCYYILPTHPPPQYRDWHSIIERNDFHVKRFSNKTTTKKSPVNIGPVLSANLYARSLDCRMYTVIWIIRVMQFDLNNYRHFFIHTESRFIQHELSVRRNPNNLSIILRNKI